MFEGNTISLKDNNVTPLSEGLAILYLASSTISFKQILVLLNMHLIDLKKGLHLPKRTLSQLPSVFESNTFFRTRLTPFKETQSPSRKKHQMNGRTWFTSPNLHIPKGFINDKKCTSPRNTLRIVIIHTFVSSMVCKGSIWPIHDALETRLIRCGLDYSGLILRINTSKK